MNDKPRQGKLWESVKAVMARKYASNSTWPLAIDGCCCLAKMHFYKLRYYILRRRGDKDSPSSITFFQYLLKNSVVFWSHMQRFKWGRIHLLSILSNWIKNCRSFEPRVTKTQNCASLNKITFVFYWWILHGFCKRQSAVQRREIGGSTKHYILDYYFFLMGWLH